MRLSSLLLTTAPFAVAAALSLTAAGGIVNVVEDSTELVVRRSLDDSGLSWAEVEANGLQVFLSGTAPSEALRFRAKSVASTQVDAARIIDGMDVAERDALEAPKFSIEILRNESGISLIGLVPAQMDRNALRNRVAKIAGDKPVSDLLQTADYDAPQDWGTQVEFALVALNLADRSKISLTEDGVSVTAMTESADEKRTLESQLTRRAGSNLQLMMQISAPRPVITPFTLRFVLTETGGKFDACSADTQATRDRILTAAKAAGLSDDNATCQIGLGVPSVQWADMVERALAALAQLGGGSLTIADTDVALNAALGTDAALFDRVIGELENSLPDLFSLQSDLPVPIVESDDVVLPPEFTATLSPEGLVQMRGRVGDALSRDATESYAHARFGSANVHNAARLDDALPANWPMRVLTGLSALSHLSNGAVVVTEDSVAVSGNTGVAEASDRIAGLMAGKLGETANFTIDVTYLEQLDPIAALPSPEDCVASVQAILASRKINFEPGSDTPDAAAQGVLDDIAAVLGECPEIRIEISGHTDSQGRESMNQALSQARAQAVLNGLRERRLLTATYRAVGYGETKPIASNDSEKGREANRRIEFKLVRTEPTEEEQSALDALADASSTQTAPADGADAKETEAKDGEKNDE